jgi:hypothetical protein
VLVIQSRVSVFCLLRDSAGSFGLLCLFVTCYLSSPLVDVDVVSGGVRMAGSFTEPWPCFRAPVDGDGGAGSLVVDVAKGGAGVAGVCPFLGPAVFCPTLNLEPTQAFMKRYRAIDAGSSFMLCRHLH